MILYVRNCYNVKVCCQQSLQYYCFSISVIQTEAQAVIKLFIMSCRIHFMEDSYSIDRQDGNVTLHRHNCLYVYLNLIVMKIVE
jgi:hypothetical protein